MMFPSEVAINLDSRLSTLNPHQRAAVEECAGTAGVNVNVQTVVDGPPGTGKTTVCAFAALEYLRANCHELQSRHVIILSYTNTSADRCLQSVAELGGSPNLVLRLMPRASRPPLGVDGRYYLRFDSEAELTHEEQQRLRSARILLTTTYAANRAFKVTRRPLLVFDEVSQISMGNYLGILGEGRRSGRDIDRIALVGDPAQLPVVTSQGSLETNAASFLQAHLPNLRAHQLVLQYRMHPMICAVVNKARDALGCFPLETADVAKERTLKEVYGEPMTVERSAWAVPIVEPSCPVVAVDTDGLPGAEERAGTSWQYQAEAEASVAIGRLLAGAYKNLDLVLVSPYTLQRETMQAVCRDELRCLSVHESQGQEYDCVILSLTRRNDGHKVGFLGEMLPLSYVAFSRARCKLILLFSFSTFMGSNFPQEIVDFLVNDRAVAKVRATSIMMDWRP